MSDSRDAIYELQEQLEKAADEIERLRAALVKIAWDGDELSCKVAAAALKAVGNE